jgi:uncharacterized protein (TIRG00374 family)
MDQQDGALNTAVARRAQRSSQFARRAASYLVAAVCLVWVFHDIHPVKLGRSLTTVNWWWIALAVALDILSYFCQGLRWRLLLLPVGKLSTFRVTQAIYAGLFTNEVLPMRFGEVVRAFLVSRWLSASFASIVPSMIVERLLDGVWLALAVGLAALFVRLPRDVLDVVDIFALAVLVSIGLFIYIVYREDKASYDETTLNQSAPKVRGLLVSLVGRIGGGLRSIGLSRFLFMSLGVSLAMLSLQALAFWLVMRAYRLPLPFWVGGVVFLIVHLGTAIPGAPANVGSYQFFTVVGLTLFGVEKSLAAGFSIVVFALLTIPLWIIGSLAFSLSGTTLSAVREQVTVLVSQSRMLRKPRE